MAEKAITVRHIISLSVGHCLGHMISGMKALSKSRSKWEKLLRMGPIIRVPVWIYRTLAIEMFFFLYSNTLSFGQFITPFNLLSLMPFTNSLCLEMWISSVSFLIIGIPKIISTESTLIVKTQ